MDIATFRKCYPISRVLYYPRSIVIQRQSKLQSQPRGDRKEITKLSNSSLSKLTFTVLNTSVQFCSLMTLTYGLQYPIDGKACKYDLKRFIQESRRLWGNHDYVWFLEFQRRGAPHYHILTALDAPSGQHERRREFADLWASIAAPENREYSDLKTRDLRSLRAMVARVHYHARAWERVRMDDGARRYVAKYATKVEQKWVPKEYRNVGRFWGASRSVREGIPDPVAVSHVSEEMVRADLRRLGRDGISEKPFLPKILFHKTRTNS